MNPKKLGKLDNHKQEPWKAPLPEFIEELYRKRFGKAQPERIVSIEERANELAQKKATQRAARMARKANGSASAPGDDPVQKEDVDIPF